MARAKMLYGMVRFSQSDRSYSCRWPSVPEKVRAWFLCVAASESKKDIGLVTGSLDMGPHPEQV